MSFITLFQLNNLIQSTLEQQLEPTYWVVSEIGEMRITQKGHCYLELVEKEGQYLTAKVRANIWAYDYRNLSGFFQSVTGKKLATGMKVLTKVGVQFHEVYGLSLHIKDLDPNFTLGERAKQKQLIIDQLTAENLINLNKEKPLPLVPQRIAVISAETAAGYGDFMDQLVHNKERYGFRIQLFKSIMQGEEAKSSLVSSMEMIYQKQDEFDVVILIRGGGSQVDLDCFDSYEVAHKLAHSPLPVLTGIGHERDETIVDMVAHTRLNTPTAVAEFLLSGMKAFDQQMDHLSQRLRLAVVNQLRLQNNHLIRLGGRLDHKSKSLIQHLAHKHDLLSQRLKMAAENHVHDMKKKLDSYQEFLVTYPFRILNQEQRLVSSLASKIALANPQRILERGFTLTYKNGKVLKAGERVVPGDNIVTKTKEQSINSTVSSVKDE